MNRQGGNREKDLQFEMVYETYKKMIHHLIHKYNIQDPQGEFFQEGVIALWNAYQKYGDRDTFGKLAYITIRSRIIDLIRKKNRLNTHETATEIANESSYRESGLEDFDPYFWDSVQQTLTSRQWIFVQRKIIEGRTYQDIAALEQTTIDAVKGWGKEVKKKLRPLLAEHVRL